MKLLESFNLSHTYEYKLFEDVSLELHPRESMAIIGVSGSGKSTLLHILATLLTPHEGRVVLFGKDVATMSKKELVTIKREMLGIVFQQHYLFRGFSAQENIEVAALLAHQEIDTSLIERLKIATCQNKKVANLSGGQQQRVSIARVLTKKPRIIFADEPTGNLDTQTSHDVMELFFEYIKEHEAGFVIVTHDEPLAFRCDKVYRLENRELQRVK